MQRYIVYCKYAILFPSKNFFNKQKLKAYCENHFFIDNFFNELVANDTLIKRIECF